MTETMVRKQVYLKADQERKLKALAARRRCTEAELIREALDRLPDPTDDAVLLKLEAAGLLAPEPDTRGPQGTRRSAATEFPGVESQGVARGRADAVDAADAQAVARLEAEHDAWLA